MKKYISFVILVAFYVATASLQCVFAQPPGEWTWMQGSDTITNAQGVFGTLGVPDPVNSPPGFYEPVEWTDKNGNFWLFTGFNGGAAFGVFGDVWKFDPILLQWTWMHGTGLSNPPVVLGTQGVSSPLNSPGSDQWCGATWVDTSGNFWLFGGSNGSGSSSSLLWKYDPVINEWTWMNGPPTNGAPGVYGTQGIPDPANYPTARWETNAAWTDNNNNLWLYGGLNAPGDYLMKYDISINQWTWIKGSAGGVVNYGTLGVSSPSNSPGNRQVYAKWKDATGDLWMFGGNGSNNDVWKYVISTNEWTWMSGSNMANDPGNYGPQCSSSTSYLPSARYENRACWIDNNGSFWTYGGYMFSDLWKYCPATNEWTLENGNQSAAVGVYGTRGVSSPLNIPGARMGSVGWKDNSGNFWMWGGWVGISNAANDLWRFVPDPACGLCSSVPVALFAAPNHICPGTCTDFNNLSVNATSYLWTFAGANPNTSTDANPANICYNTPGQYGVTLVATNAFGSDTLQLNNFITVYPYPAPQGIAQSGDTLIANQGSVSYQWYHNGLLISGATDYFYVAQEGGDYNVVATDANGCEVEAAIFNVVAGLTAALSKGEGVMVFPNPVGDQLAIASGQWTINTISIYNILGDLVSAVLPIAIRMPTAHYQLLTYSIDVSVLPSGMYYLEVSSAGKIFRTKFIKQ